MKKLNGMKKQLGQGMTEYIIIVALVAVAAIGAYGMFGNTVQESLANLADEVSGKASTTTVAQGLAKKAHEVEVAKRQKEAADLAITKKAKAKLIAEENLL